MSETAMKKQALLIGINDYPILPKLNFARQDAEAVEESLKQNYCFSDDEIMLLTDSKPGLFKPINRRVIEKHLENLADQELDLFIFGFWGHGLFRNGQRYFCPLDAIADDIENLGLSFSSLQQLLSNIKAKNTCLILDCCQSIHDRGESETLTAADQALMENAARDIVWKRKEKEPEIQSNVAILNSCKEGQSAYEWDARQHGLFTALLLDAMKKRSSSIIEIASYISSAIGKTALELGKEQTPFFKLEGNIPLPVDTTQAQPDPVQPHSKPPFNPMHISVPDDFATIEEAYDHVQDGGVISIQPGIYELSSTLELNRSVTFRGSTGQAENVAVVCSSAHAFLITGGSPSFQNITVVCEAEKGASFYVTGGSPKLFCCVITSRKWCGMAIKGSAAAPQVESCTFKNCGGCGILVYENGRGSFNDCDIYRNVSSGIQVKTSGNPSLTNCKIHDGKGGAAIYDNGLGSFINCEIYSNECHEIMVKTSGNPTVAGCKIHDGKQYGVVVNDNGLGKFNNCEIYGNEFPGILVETSGNPTVAKCKIYDGKSSGIWVNDSGLGSFTGCKIYGNAKAGIEVSKSGNPTFTGCKIHDGKGGGVLVHNKGMGTFNNNTLENNYWKDKLYNWYIHPDSGAVNGSDNTPAIPKRWFGLW